MSRCLALANESRNLGPDIDDHLAQWSAAIDDAQDCRRTPVPDREGPVLRARLATSYALADRWEEATSMCEEAKREAAGTLPRCDPQRQWIAQLSEMIRDQDVFYDRAARRPEN